MIYLDIFVWVFFFSPYSQPDCTVCFVSLFICNMCNCLCIEMCVMFLAPIMKVKSYFTIFLTVLLQTQLFQYKLKHMNCIHYIIMLLFLDEDVFARTSFNSLHWNMNFSASEKIRAKSSTKIWVWSFKWRNNWYIVGVIVATFSYEYAKLFVVDLPVINLLFSLSSFFSFSFLYQRWNSM